MTKIPSMITNGRITKNHATSVYPFKHKKFKNQVQTATKRILAKMLNSLILLMMAKIIDIDDMIRYKRAGLHNLDIIYLITRKKNLEKKVFKKPIKRWKITTIFLRMNYCWKTY